MLPNVSRMNASSWEFVTSEGGEFNALIVTTGKGSLYLRDKNDPDQIVHEMMYVGIGGSISVGSPVGGSFSTPDMYSEGAGPVLMASNKKALVTNDFSGHGLIVAGQIAGAIVAGVSWSMVFFGIPPFTRAAVKVKSAAWMAPQAGFSATPVWFTLDP